MECGRINRNIFDVLLEIAFRLVEFGFKVLFLLPNNFGDDKVSFKVDLFKKLIEI